MEGAIREFAEKGYEGATTAGIARRARSNQPLVHHHFGSKEKLFRLVLDSLFEQLQERVLAPEKDSLDVRALLRRFVLFTAERPELARIWVIESARGGRHVNYMLEKHIGPLSEHVRPLLAQAMREGLIPEGDPRLLLYAIQGLASYPFLVPEQVRQLSGGDPCSAEFANAYADMVLALMLSPKAGARRSKKPAAD
ncbi:TetR/AcrR family transcriptional regulator [Pyxidicoccus sp. MSG2]|uniref:TetR/AcrR family transcriptional regulator n=1 Tax=Pyxidicoccus sp. MSG2 TaxID=2996790 RepID=UPI0022700CB0|nr:TetR/AcrR family transcriptional regulator [Pyxidicoccus sp. MSG2]MCY1021658.1 TetR/AcrR family transcriptional regulator [Pyxidicoccus sp. MSG2]